MAEPILTKKGSLSIRASIQGMSFSVAIRINWLVRASAIILLRVSARFLPIPSMTFVGLVNLSWMTFVIIGSSAFGSFFTTREMCAFR